MKLEEVKRQLNKPVRYETAGGDREYLLTGCILRKNDKGYFYQAELQDIANQKSILICRLDDVKAGDPGMVHFE